ncbi:MAG: FAD-binding oxidoreductase, partial [Gammaproteobacteria bacterium]|nr:FAD-binding oxidoreductase [Gammaproteobacteria bacterium]
MTECDFLIIGGGMGGASCAYWLSREHRVIVLEMEDQPGYHSTGRSAAVYTEAYGPRAVRALAKSSGDFFRHPPQGFAPGPLAEQHGLVCIAREDQKPALYEALAAVQDLSPEIHEIDVGEAIERVPVLRRGYLAAAFLDPSTLFLDVNAIHHGYLRGLRANGGDIVTRAEATRIKRKADRWRVTTPAGEFVAPVIINAAGAWADVVAERAGARSIALQPKRRTVIAFAPPGNVDHRDWPLTFDTDEQFYF